MRSALLLRLECKGKQKPGGGFPLPTDFKSVYWFYRFMVLHYPSCSPVPQQKRTVPDHAHPEPAQPPSRKTRNAAKASYGRIAVLSTDVAVGWFVVNALKPYAEARGLAVLAVPPRAALNKEFLNTPHNPLALLVIPGARSSLAFRQQLGEAGFGNLRDYARYGAILGICQGFYLLSTHIRYKDMGGNEKENNNNLNLLPGVTYGDMRTTEAFTRPAEGWYEADVLSVRFSSFTKKRGQTEDISCFYWGGPVYSPSEPVKPLACYPSFRTMIAAASRTQGEGCVVGLSPHLEVSSSLLREAFKRGFINHASKTRYEWLAQQLEPEDRIRTELFHAILDSALMQTPFGQTPFGQTPFGQTGFEQTGFEQTRFWLKTPHSFLAPPHKS